MAKARNKITHSDKKNPLKQWEIDEYREEELKAIKKFSRVIARMERLKQIQKNTRFLRCEYEDEAYRKRVLLKYPELHEFEVPLDSRFID